MADKSLSPKSIKIVPNSNSSNLEKKQKILFKLINHEKVPYNIDLTIENLSNKFISNEIED